MSDDKEYYPKMLKRCRDCMHFKLKLQHTHKPTLDDTISWLLAEENIQALYCKKGRLRYSDGREKMYTSKYPLRLESDTDAECPDFEPDEFVDEEDIL